MEKKDRYYYKYILSWMDGMSKFESGDVKIPIYIKEINLH